MFMDASALALDAEPVDELEWDLQNALGTADYMAMNPGKMDEPESVRHTSGRYAKSMAPPSTAPPPEIQPRSRRPVSGSERPLSGESDLSRLSLSSTGSNFSRARVLQQQRELQVKRRQQANHPAAIRINKDAVGVNMSAINSPGSQEGSFTPAMKQPRIVEDTVYSAFRGDGLGTPRSQGLSEFEPGQRPKSSPFLAEEAEEQARERESERRKKALAREQEERLQIGSSVQQEDSGWVEAESGSMTPRSKVFFDNSLDITEPTKEFDRSETGPEVVPQPSKDSKDSSHDAKSSKKERTKRSSDKKKPAIPEDHYTTDEEEHPVSRGKSRSKKSAQSGSKKAEIARHHKRESSDSDHSLQRSVSTGSELEARCEDEESTQGMEVATIPRGVKVSVPPEDTFNPDALNLENMFQFLTTPCPKEAGTVQCYIRRKKSRAYKLFPEYQLFMKEGDRFLMCSKKRPNNKTSNYLISMKAGDLNRDSPNFLGKVRANFVGTEFQIFDNGVNPHDAAPGKEKYVRKELGAVMYASNVLGARGPRRMQVGIPFVDSHNNPTAIPPAVKEDEIVSRMKNHDYQDIVYLINKPPRWNDQVGAYVLNFSGRVTMASVKNFQLVTPEAHDSIVLQFGRVAKDEFTMDFQWPISPLQAFAVTLSSFDSKICCD